MLLPGNVLVYGLFHGSLWASGVLGLVGWGYLVFSEDVQMLLDIGAAG